MIPGPSCHSTTWAAAGYLVDDREVDYDALAQLNRLLTLEGGQGGAQMQAAGTAADYGCALFMDITSHRQQCGCGGPPQHSVRPGVRHREHREPGQSLDLDHRDKRDGER